MRCRHTAHHTPNSPPDMLMVGHAYLVGAGPGRSDYITLRGWRLLQQADAILYDALIDPTLLADVAADCDCICVGKRGGQPSLSQANIDALLVQTCQQGKQVVRLKSGDPFIFGRTTSEIQALKRAGIPFEVVPGISSALAAPLLAGIPLTDPVMSRCFAVLSAHAPEELDWDSLAALETLVILMGTRHLDWMVQALLERGRSPATPIAILQWVSHPAEQIWAGTLQTITQLTARQSLAPAVIVVGDVVNLRSFLQSDGQPDGV